MEYKSEANLKINSEIKKFSQDSSMVRLTPHTTHYRSGNPHTLDSFDWLPPALVFRVLVLLCRFSIQFEAAWTDIHFIIVEVRLVGAVATAHIACDLCVLDLLPIKAKEAVALHERCLVNVPGATEAGHEVDGVARTHI